MGWRRARSAPRWPRPSSPPSVRAAAVPSTKQQLPPLLWTTTPGANFEFDTAPLAHVCFCFLIVSPFFLSPFFLYFYRQDISVVSMSIKKNPKKNDEFYTRPWMHTKRVQSDEFATNI